MRIIYPNPMRFPNQKANAVQVIHTCRALAEKGHEVHLLVSRVETATAAEGLAVYGLCDHPHLIILSPAKQSRRRYLLFLLGYLRRYKNAPETVLYLRNKSMARLLIRWRRCIGLPCVFESHSLKYLARQDRASMQAGFGKRRAASGFDFFKTWRYHRLEKAIYSRADGVVCQTRGLAEVVGRRFAVSAPIAVIHSGAAVTPVEAGRGRGEEILYLGQLYPMKGVDLLVEALGLLPHRRLLIVGGNKQADIDRIQRLAARLGVQARITLTGYVPHRRIGGYFRRTGVAVIPILDVLETRLFTSPLKLFEYMAAGIPIVASDLPSIREILQHGESAVLVPPNDPRALAKGIEQVLTDADLAARLARNALALVKTYSWENRAARLARFLEDVVTGDHRAACPQGQCGCSARRR